MPTTTEAGTAALKVPSMISLWRSSETVTMFSAGMPMILMGDEVRRTQHGNNNGYCQDNETSWFDWTLLTTHADLYRAN
jgi:pullulanase/glycogen debranching enzyme